MGQEYSLQPVPARECLRTAGPAGWGHPRKVSRRRDPLASIQDERQGSGEGWGVAGAQRLGLGTLALPSATGSDRDPQRQHCLRRHFRWAGLGVGNGPAGGGVRVPSPPTGRALASLHPAPSSHGSLSGL